MGMYGSMVGKIAGTSSGARALRAITPMAERVTARAGIGGAAGYLGRKAGSSSGVRSQLYGAGARAANAVAAHPMRAMGGAVGAAGAAGMSRRRGSQNYPMY